MALALGSRQERRNPNMDRMTKLLERMVVPSVRDKARDKKNADEPSEWERYHEQETWRKLKTDRHKDLVLMSEDRDEVRIYYRSRGGNDGGRRQPKRNLDTIGLDDEYHDSIRPVALATKTLTAASSKAISAANADSSLHRGPLEDLMKRRRSEIQQDEVTSDVDEAADLPEEAISKQQWTEIIRRTSSGNQHHRRTRKKEKKRVRHHRLSCKFHPYSTGAEFRRMSLATAFPTGVLRQSLSRVQHAANGASSGMSTPVPVETFFVEPTVLPQQQGGAGSGARSVGTASPTPSTAGSGGTAPPSEAPAGGGVTSGPGTAGFLTPSLGLAGSMTPLSDTSFGSQRTPLPEPIDSSVSGVPKGSPIVADAGTGDSFFMTQPTSVAERCPAPVTSRFELPLRAHSLEGEFNDCICTPRSTDGESSDDEDEHGRKKQITSAKSSERKLSLWKRHFDLVTVRGLATLNSVLEEREEHRSVLCNERSHLDHMTQGAELAGSDWTISRRIRCTTPSHSSVWSDVFQTAGDHERLIARNRELYVSTCDKAAADFGFPSQPLELEMFEMVRIRCMKCSELQPTPDPRPASGLGSRSQTPSMSSRPSSRLQPLSGTTSRATTPGIGSGGMSRPQSQLSGRPPPARRRVRPPSPVEPPTVEKLPIPPDGYPFTSDFFQLFFDRFGQHLVGFKNGVLFINRIREQCNYSPKLFFTTIQRHVEHGDWYACHEVTQLHKRLMASRGGLGSVDPDGEVPHEVSLSQASTPQAAKGAGKRLSALRRRSTVVSVQSDRD